MSRKSKMDNAAKLINIISTLIERNEKLLQHIGDLEEYIHALECMNDFEEGEKIKAGENLLTLEAMKMENIITADKDIKIKKINMLNTVF